MAFLPQELKQLPNSVRAELGEESTARGEQTKALLGGVAVV